MYDIDTAGAQFQTYQHAGAKVCKIRYPVILLSEYHAHCSPISNILNTYN
jgi:hypothetical protein